ncbi:hypothetical protein ES703_03233 [subsurface metagenome]
MEMAEKHAPEMLKPFESITGQLADILNLLVKVPSAVAKYGKDSRNEHRQYEVIGWFIDLGFGTGDHRPGANGGVVIAASCTSKRAL